MSYTDFLGETIAEHYRTGKTRKPNPNNGMAKARSKFRMKMEKEAADRGKDVEEIALGYVEQNAGQLQRYVISKGELPEETTAGLAMQTYDLRSREVNDIAAAMGCDYATAEAYLDEAENKAIEMNSPEADSFIGELFDAIGRIAGKGLQKASDKRQAKGKGAGVAGFFANLLNPGTAQGEPVEKIDLKAEAQKIIDEITAKKKKEEIKKMMPMIIVGVVVLILVVVLITKKASK